MLFFEKKMKGKIWEQIFLNKKEFSVIFLLFTENRLSLVFFCVFKTFEFV